jgi:hypothetical protein
MNALTGNEVLREALECIPGKTWEEKLSEVIRCECCPRHMTDRPTKLGPWVELPWSPRRGGALPALDFAWRRGANCICKCRHHARFICRQVCEDESYECPLGSPREVEVETVLSPGERAAWLEHLDQQEIVSAMATLGN